MLNSETYKDCPCAASWCLNARIKELEIRADQKKTDNSSAESCFSIDAHEITCRFFSETFLPERLMWFNTLGHIAVNVQEDKRHIMKGTLTDQKCWKWATGDGVHRVNWRFPVLLDCKCKNLTSVQLRKITASPGGQFKSIQTKMAQLLPDTAKLEGWQEEALPLLPTSVLLWLCLVWEDVQEPAAGLEPALTQAREAYLSLSMQSRETEHSGRVWGTRFEGFSAAKQTWWLVGDSARSRRPPRGEENQATARADSLATGVPVSQLPI